MFGKSKRPRLMGRDSSPNWVDLPREVTAEILSRVDDFDVLRDAQFVCTSWRSICKDPLRWRTINLRVLDRQDFRSEFDYAFVTALDYSSGQASDITVDGFCSDYALDCITRSCHRVKCLRLRGCKRITGRGLCNAIKKLPLLEELEILGGAFSACFMSALKDCCPRFRSLSFRSRGDVYSDTTLNSMSEIFFNISAKAIAETLPGLHSLDIAGNTLDDEGLREILDGCPNLESLDLRCCFNLEMGGDLRRRCEENIKRVLYPGDGNDLFYL